LSFFRVFINLFQFNRTNWKVVALCFTTATVFWLFNALNKSHTTNIRFPIRFEYDQQKYVPAEPLPQQVMLNLSGNGWDLFRKHFGLKTPTLVIPLDKPEMKQVSGYSLLSVFASQIANLKINFVVTDSLRIHLDEKLTRKFRLTADLSGITYKKGFGRISPVVILPDSSALTGPKSIISKMPDSIVLNMQEKKLNENFRGETEIALPSAEFISRNPPIAEVMFEVGEMVEVNKWVKIRPGKVPWGMELVNDSVQVVFQVPQKTAEHLASSSPWASLDFSDLRKGETRRFYPRVEGLPAWASVVKIDSITVRRY
jgi:hypothetical protein